MLYQHYYTFRFLSAYVLTLHRSASNSISTLRGDFAHFGFTAFLIGAHLTIHTKYMLWVRFPRATLCLICWFCVTILMCLGFTCCMLFMVSLHGSPFLLSISKGVLFRLLKFQSRSL